MVWRRLVSRNFDQITRVLVILIKSWSGQDTLIFAHQNHPPVDHELLFQSNHQFALFTDSWCIEAVPQGSWSKMQNHQTKNLKRAVFSLSISKKAEYCLLSAITARTPGWKQESYIQGVDARLTSSVPGCPDSWFYVIDVGKNIIIFLDTHFQNVSGNLMQISFWEVKVEAVFTNRFYLNMPFTTFHHSKYTLINGVAHARKT